MITLQALKELLCEHGVIDETKIDEDNRPILTHKKTQQMDGLAQTI